MAVHSTDYRDTLIEVAEDCPVAAGEVPPHRGDTRSVANHQFDLLHDRPYRYTSDEVTFTVFADRRGIAPDAREAERRRFFAKGQPCLRASPLTKRYGWGVHSDAAGRVALYGVGTPEYQRLVEDAGVRKVRAMRSSR